MLSAVIQRFHVRMAAAIPTAAAVTASADSKLIRLFQCLVSGIFVLGMDQQRDIQVAGGDQKHFNAGHGQCIQGTSGHTAAGNHVLAKKVQFGIADTDCLLYTSDAADEL